MSRLRRPGPADFVRDRRIHDCCTSNRDKPAQISGDQNVGWHQLRGLPFDDGSRGFRTATYSTTTDQMGSRLGPPDTHCPALANVELELRAHRHHSHCAEHVVFVEFRVSRGSHLRSLDLHPDLHRMRNRGEHGKSVVASSVGGAGASGAIFGLAGALIAALYLGKLPIPKAALKGTLKSLLTFAGYNLVFGAVGSFIDNSAHVGGLLMGLAIGALMAPHLTNPEERGRWRMLVFGAAAILLTAGTQYVKKVDAPAINQFLQHANESHPTPDLLSSRINNYSESSSSPSVTTLAALPRTE